MLKELNLGAKLFEEGTDHHVVEVTHPQIGMFVGTQTILRIQDLAREATLRMLELIEVWIIASIKLLPSSLKWQQCSTRLMGCLFHLPYNSQEWRYCAWKFLTKMSTQLGMDKAEHLRSVTMLEILETLVMNPKEVTVRMKDHAMWSSILKIVYTKEFVNTVICETTSTANSMAQIYVTGLMNATLNMHIIWSMTLSISAKCQQKFRITLSTNRLRTCKRKQNGFGETMTLEMQRSETYRSKPSLHSVKTLGWHLCLHILNFLTSSTMERETLQSTWRLTKLDEAEFNIKCFLASSLFRHLDWHCPTLVQDHVPRIHFQLPPTVKGLYFPIHRQ